MLPGLLLKNTTYSLFCLTSFQYHFILWLKPQKTNHVFFILDTLSQHLACFANAQNTHGKIIIGILSALLSFTGWKYQPLVFTINGLCILTSNGSRKSIKLWLGAFFIFFLGKVTRKRYFHVVFHLMSHLAMRKTLISFNSCLRTIAHGRF